MPTAPESLPKASWAKASSRRADVAVGLEGEAGEPQAEGRRLGVDAVGAADAERVAVLQRPLDQGVAVGAGAGDDDLAGPAQLQRQRRVEHVGGGEAVMDPAPVLADRAGDDVDEGGDVMVGHPLPLVDRLDRERGPSARAASAASPGNDALLGPRLGRRQLDLQPALHLRLRRPDLPDLGTGIAGDHQQLIIRAARTPAFFAPSIATQATGIPGGICTAESRASSPPRRLAEDRHADHRQLGVGGGDAGQRRRHPGPGDDHLHPPHPRVLAVLADHLGVAVGAHHPHLVADAGLVQRLRRPAASSACRSSSP